MGASDAAAKAIEEYRKGRRFAPEPQRGHPKALLIFKTAVLCLVCIFLAYSVARVSMHRSTPVPVHRLEVRVVYGRLAPVGAEITLHPRSGTLPREALPRGRVGKDGLAAITTYPEAEGVPKGDYVATVQWYRVASDGSVGGNSMPKRYASASSSPLLVTVESGSNPTLTLPVVSKR